MVLALLVLILVIVGGEPLGYLIGWLLKAFLCLLVLGCFLAFPGYAWTALGVFIFFAAIIYRQQQHQHHK